MRYLPPHGRCPARGARFIDPCARLTNLQLKEDIGIRAELRSQQPGRRRAVEPFPAGLFVWAGLAAVKRRDVAQAQVRNDAAARLDTEALHRSNHVIGIQLACCQRRHDCDSFSHPDYPRNKRCAASVLDINQNQTQPSQSGPVRKRTMFVTRSGLLINHAPTVRTDGSINRLAGVRSCEKLAVAAHLLALWRVLVLDDTLRDFGRLSGLGGSQHRGCAACTYRAPQ